jgi:hypothetical protein
VQEPPEHAVPVVFGGAPHAWPQEPQLLTLEARETSQPFAGLPSQLAQPALHPVTRQVLPLQAELAFDRLHRWPQLPQSAGLVVVSTHEPPQLVRPAWHDTVHAPPEHTSPAGHTWPHVPQLLVSLLVAVHTPPHRICPEGHAQLPPPQV